MMTTQQEAHAGMFLRRALEFILGGAVLLLGLGILLLEGAWAHPVYSLLENIAPNRAWGALFTVLGTMRCMIVTINGFWPLSPVARFSLSCATLVFAWLPIAATFLAYLRLFLIGNGEGGFLPGAVLIGVAVMTEGLCMYALMALKGARKNVG